MIKDKASRRRLSNEKGNRVQIFNLKFRNNFLLIDFSDGSSMPRNPLVYDNESHTLKDNPRKKNQIEPKNYFAIIDFNTSYLWLNNTKKKTLLVNFIQKYFKRKQFILKDIYSEQDFIKTLETLDGLKISAVPGIFTQTNTLSSALEDEMYPASKAELRLSYNNVSVVDTIKDKILNILDHQVSFQNITISGRDKKGLGMFFNNNQFSRKISFKSTVDENGMFLPNDVFDLLITKIEDENK